MHYQTNKKFTLIFALLICVSQVFSSLHGMLAPQKTDYKKIFFNYLQDARSQLMSKLPSAKLLVSKKALGAAIIAMLAMLYYWEQNCFSESTNRNPAVSFESLEYAATQVAPPDEIIGLWPYLYKQITNCNINPETLKAVCRMHVEKLKPSEHLNQTLKLLISNLQFLIGNNTPDTF